MLVVSLQESDALNHVRLRDMIDVKHVTDSQVNVRVWALHRVEWDMGNVELKCHRILLFVFAN